MSAKQLPTIEYLRQCVRVEDGKVFWLERPRDHFTSDNEAKRWNNQWAGKMAGGLIYRCDEDARWVIGLDCIHIYRYQVVWAIHHGAWPSLIDHKNHDASDDRIENLRQATHAQNIANSRLSKVNTSGFKGVSWCKRTKKWQVAISVNSKSIYLGRFVDRAEAHAAYLAAAIKYKGEFACSG